LRRYAVANGCTRLFTFTWATSQRDRGAAVREWHAFVLRLRAAGYPVAWLRAFEWHPGGHGLHIHAGLGSYVPIALMESLWGHGHVDVQKIRTRRGGREDARMAAVYLSKYAGKAAVADVGQHSYEVAQGFAVAVVEIEHRSADAVFAALARRMNGPPAYEWRSGDDSDWRGPPARYEAW
jgi:hypothetical protein